MDLRWGTIGQTLVWPFIIVELEVAFESLCEGWDGGIVFQVNVFIRD